MQGASISTSHECYKLHSNRKSYTVWCGWSLLAVLSNDSISFFMQTKAKDEKIVDIIYSLERQSRKLISLSAWANFISKIAMLRLTLVE